MAPYDDRLYVDKGDGYSGWADNHTVGTPDSWTDDAYKSPDDYVYRNARTRRRSSTTGRWVEAGRRTTTP